MGNSIALAEKYLPILDEVYKAASKTAILDAANNRIKFVGGNKVELFKTSLVGLGNYSRNSGFVTGDVTATWESMTLSKDRGRSFMMDAMDNEETLGMAFGTLAGEFIRTKVVPELDAYRFATLASTSGITTVSADLASNTKVNELISAAEATLGDDEVPEEGRILFVSEECYKTLKNNLTRTILNGDNGYSNMYETYDGMPVIKVPKNRFVTKVTLNDGSSQSQTSGGYAIPTDGSAYYINFMIVHPSAIVQVTKHVLPRIFSPLENQTADAWKFDYRIYHDIFVEANKVAGIYVHKKNTAIS